MENEIYLTKEFFKSIGLREWPEIMEMRKLMARHRIVWCWGAHAYGILDGKILSFRVQGRLFTGRVWIAVNGSDLFNIYFTGVQRSENGCYKVKDKIEDVYLEDLIEIIDRKVETP